MTWRDVKKVHPACMLFPAMSPEELKALGEDIKKNGLQSEVVLQEHEGEEKVLDGCNRLDAMELVGLQVTEGDGLGGDIHSWNVRYLTKDVEPYAFVISANIHRRHLTAEQKRQLIGKLLEANPRRSDREIGRIVKADNKTVAAERVRKEAREEIPHVETRDDSKGRSQPAKKPPVSHPGPASPEEIAAMYYKAELVGPPPEREIDPAATVPPAREPSQRQIEAMRQWGHKEARATSGLHWQPTTSRFTEQQIAEIKAKYDASDKTRAALRKIQKDYGFRYKHELESLLGLTPEEPTPSTSAQPRPAPMTPKAATSKPIVLFHVTPAKDWTASTPKANPDPAPAADTHAQTLANIASSPIVERPDGNLNLCRFLLEKIEDPEDVQHLKDLISMTWNDLMVTAFKRAFTEQHPWRSETHADRAASERESIERNIADLEEQIAAELDPPLRAQREEKARAEQARREDERREEQREEKRRKQKLKEEQDALAAEEQEVWEDYQNSPEKQALQPLREKETALRLQLRALQDERRAAALQSAA